MKFCPLTVLGGGGMLPLMKSKVVAFSVFLGLLLSAFGQDYAPPPAPEGQLLSSEQLYQMLGPIALYPDPLISEILPACAQPAQIAIAYTYISSGNDPNSIDQQNWDPNVQ